MTKSSETVQFSDELKGAEAALKAAKSEGDEEATMYAQNRVDGLKNAMSLASGGVATKAKK